MTRISERQPGSDVLLQKIPDVGGESELVRAMFPAARFIHVVRDPRAVVASLTAGSKGWARDWAPSGVARAARLWRDVVRTALTIPASGAAYLEVRYEALHAAPIETLAGVHRFLGLESDARHCEAAFAACRFEDFRERRSTARAPWPINEHREGFFRRGEVDAWRDELRPHEVRRVESTAWDLDAGTRLCPGALPPPPGIRPSLGAPQDQPLRAPTRTPRAPLRRMARPPLALRRAARRAGASRNTGLRPVRRGRRGKPWRIPRRPSSWRARAAAAPPGSATSSRPTGASASSSSRSIDAMCRRPRRRGSRCGPTAHPTRSAPTSSASRRSR